MSPTINDMPRQKLRELIAQYGKGLCDDPHKAEGLLRDYCSEYKREVNVLASALREGFVKDLLASSTISMAPELVIASLAKRMFEDVGFAQDLSTWAIESWANALGLPIVSPKQATVVTPLPTQNVVQPQNLSWMPKVVVSKKGDGQFTSITDAIAKVSVGTEILVRPGLYKESLIVNKQVVISGDGDMLSIIINGGENPSLIARTDLATVRNITLVSKSKQAVVLESTQLIMEDCLVGNTIGAGIGVSGLKANPTIRKCRFETKYHCIEITNSAQGLIEKCEGNANSKVFSVFISTMANPVIRNSKLKDLSVSESGQGIIENCVDLAIDACIQKAAKPHLRYCLLGTVSFNSGCAGIIENCTLEHSMYRSAFYQGNITINSATPSLKNLVFNKEGQQCKIITTLIEITGACEPVIEDCNLNGGSTFSGNTAISVTKTAHPIIRRCRIRGFEPALKIFDEGEATVEDCDLSGNGKVWDVQAGCYLERSNNKE